MANQIQSHLALKLATLTVSSLMVPLAGAGLPNRVSSPDIHIIEESVPISDEDAFQVAGGAAIPIFVGNLPVAADLDAAHAFDNGQVLFSLDITAELGGTTYRPRDVIRFDGSSWSMEFDGTAAGIPDGVNVDAVAVNANDLLISLDVTAMLDGVVYEDADIISWDGNDFSMFLDASTTGLDDAADVDAVNLPGGSTVNVSFETGGIVDGVDYEDQDVVSWDSPNWSGFYFPSGPWVAADLDAWSVSEFNFDLFFEDGFETPP